MNIVMNVPEVELGPVLEQLKEFSMPLTPANRGFVFGDHEFLRQIHNSFARYVLLLDFWPLTKIFFPV